MRICIHKSIIGTERHLIHNKAEGLYLWSDYIPEDVWLFGKSERFLKSLDVIVSALGLDIGFDPGEGHIKSWQSLGKTAENVMWSYALSPSMFQSCVSLLLDQLWCVLDEVNDTYYTREFLVGRNLILGLERASIDKQKYDTFCKDPENIRTIRNIKTFLPEPDGFAKKVMYSQTSSVTGRLTVKSGPSILTTKKEVRSVIKSRHPDGIVAQIDFRSLEPRILLLSQGKVAGDDIYLDILNNALEGATTREVAKKATLGSIFGMSAKKFESVSGIPRDQARSILRDVRKYFGISNIGKDLWSEYHESGFISNMYGRKIFPSSGEKHVLINNKIQSSGVDVALVGFANLVEALKKKSIEVSPIFIVHDSIIIDFPRESLEEVKETVSHGIEIPSLSGKFPLSFEILN